MPTKIETVDETWNPETGCSPVSEGCENCYAEPFALRLAGRAGYPARPYHFRVTLHPNRLAQPLGWAKPRRIFVCSMGDLFHPDVPEYFLDNVFTTIFDDRNNEHQFLILTKRPQRMRDYLAIDNYQAMKPNAWLGVTAENQARADERIPVLLSIPAAVRFVSIEPMLGPVELTEYVGFHVDDVMRDDQTTGKIRRCLDWVIVGCETGPGRRAMLPRWARSVKDQCAAAGVPFFLKQTYRNDGTLWRMPELDGRVWNEYPE